MSAIIGKEMAAAIAYDMFVDQDFNLVLKAEADDKIDPKRQRVVLVVFYEYQCILEIVDSEDDKSTVNPEEKKSTVKHVDYYKVTLGLRDEPAGKDLCTVNVNYGPITRRVKRELSKK